MKKGLIISFSLAILLGGCGESKKEESKNGDTTKVAQQETGPLVQSESLNNDYLKAQQLNKAKKYFVIDNKNASFFSCTFSDSKRTGKTSVELGFDKACQKMSFEQELEEFKLILTKASTEFTFDSLYLVSIGRLFQTGNLAVDISNQYKEKYGNKDITSDYKVVSEFLAQSRLAEEINALFEPYGLMVESVTVEKAFLSPKEYFLKANVLNDDKSNVPEKILDAITWVKLKRK